MEWQADFTGRIEGQGSTRLNGSKGTGLTVSASSTEDNASVTVDLFHDPVTGQNRYEIRIQRGGEQQALMAGGMSGEPEFTCL